MTEARMQRGWRLTRESWSVVRLRPGLLAIPAISVVSWLTAAVILLGPWSLDVIDHHSRERIFVDAAICAYPLTLISTFCNVAFAALAAATIDGRPMTVGRAFARARSRLGAILFWVGISTVAGFALRSLEQVPVAGGLAGRAVEWLADIAWSLATFFIVPVLALEDVGAPVALRRSATTIRRTWGESVTGAVVVGSAFAVAGVLALAVAGAGVGIGYAGFTLGYVVAAVGGLAFVVVVTAQTAVAQVFRLALYRYASGSGATGPYAVSDFETAFRPRTRRFWR